MSAMESKVMMFRVPLGCPPGSSLPVITPEGIPLLITIPHDSFSWQEISLSYSVFYASHYVSASARNPANKTIDIITQDKLKMKITLPPETIPGCKITVPYTKVKLPFRIPLAIPSGSNPSIAVIRPDGHKMNVPISPRAYPGQLSSVMCAVASQSPEHYVIDNNPEPEPESETTLSGVSSLMKSFSQMPLGSIRSIASWTSSRAITSASKSKPKSHSGEEEGEDQEGNNESDVVQEEETTTQTQYESTEAAAGVGDVNESISVESDENLNTDDPSESNPSRILENLRTFYENTSTSSSAFFASVKSSVSKLTKRRIKKPVSKPKPYNSSSGGVNWRNAPVAFPSTRSNQKPTKSYLPSFLTKSKNPKPPTAMSLARAAVKASEPGKDPRGFLSSLMKIKPGGNKKKPVPANSRTGQSTLPTPSTQDTQRRPQRRPS